MGVCLGEAKEIGRGFVVLLTCFWDAVAVLRLLVCNAHSFRLDAAEGGGTGHER